MVLSHRYGRIEAVAVLPQFWRQGIGTASLEGAERALARQGCKVARLSACLPPIAWPRPCTWRAGIRALVTLMQRSIDDAA
jgi:GNAT superfamily N-acetyltransferase